MGIQVPDSVEPIGDDEILFRRVPASTGWYNRETGVLSPEAFQPHKANDTTGLSLAREKFKTEEQAGLGAPGKSYYVVRLRAGDVRRCGIAIEPRPYPDDPGHTECPDMNSALAEKNR